MRRRKAIITGGSTGIGRAIAIALAKSGHDIAFTYLSKPEEAGKTAESVREAGANCVVKHLDLTTPETAIPCVDEMVDELGGLDVVVNNAGMMVRRKLAEIDLDAARKIFHVNVIGAALLIKRCVEHLLPSGLNGEARPTPGRIIVITSVHERIANPEDTLYTMTKHALGGLVKCLALDLSPLNITVNAVAPGEVATPMNDMSADDAQRAQRPAIPVRRVGSPQEIAAVVDFLASPKSAFVSGASWSVDGGLEAAAPLAVSGFREQYLS
jgi:NAD(P)-dependent dehydrogenase (short-subunit alcohol dehydrogenase family)